MIRDCLCQMLNTNRIAMITALAKRFRNIQITLGRREDLTDSRQSCRSTWILSSWWDPKEIAFPTGSPGVAPVCLWKLCPTIIHTLSQCPSSACVLALKTGKLRLILIQTTTAIR